MISADTLKIEDFDNIPVFFDTLPEYSNAAPAVGYVMEFGVHGGHSINRMANILSNRIIFGFDSFEGLPEPWEKIYGVITHPKGYFATSIPKVNDNVILCKGWFCDILPIWLSEHSGSVALINIDSDLYSSAACVLEQLNDRIIPGTIIHFDELSDWFNFPQRTYSNYPNWREHEWKALLEWMEKYNRKIKPLFRSGANQAAIQVCV